MKEVLKYLGAAFLLVLLLVKASAFHIYDHHDSLNGQENQCEFCLLVIDSQQADILLVSSDISEGNIPTPLLQDQIISVDFQVNLSPSKTELLPRPPPSIL